MLPTQGLFKDIECPYNDSICGRPYCHFRHKKKKGTSQEEEPIKTVSEVPTYNPTPKSQLENTRNHIPISYVPDVISNRSSRLLSYNKPTYKPTPLSILSSANKYSKLTIKEDENNEEKYEPKSKESETNNSQGACDLSDNKDITSSEIDENRYSIKDIKNEKNDKSASVIKSKSDKHSDRKRKHSSDSAKSRHDSKHKSKHSDKKSSSSKDRSKNNAEKSKRSSSDKKKEKTRSKENDKERSKHRKDRDKEKSNAKKVPINEPVYIPTKISELEKRDDSDADMESLFGDDVEEECYKIFQEYKPEIKESSNEPFVQPNNKEQLNEDVEPYVPTTKKRIAYQSAPDKPPKSLHEKPKHVPDAAQVMINRFKIARLAQSSNEQKHLMAEIKKQSLNHIAVKNHEKPPKPEAKIVNKPSTKTSSNTSASSLIDSILTPKSTTMYKPGISLGNTDTSKKRKINPVTNMVSMLQAKAKVNELAKQKMNANATALSSKTPSQTTTKGSRRTAHIPDASLVELPDVIQFDKSKLPVNIRTRYFTMLVDETVKLYLCTEDAHNRALNEEFKVYERCSTLMTYRNSSMLALNRLRKEVQEREASGLGPLESGETPTDNKQSQFKGKTFYNNIKKYLLTEEDLVENGYPREGTVHGKPLIKTIKYIPKSNLDDNQRECARCSKIYAIDKKGFPLHQEECIYHPLRKRTFRGDSWYLCCKSNCDLGCVTSTTHVSEDVEAKLLEGFQTTITSENEDDARSYAVYALDCEMCYTTKGLELTRVTIVDADCKTVYESLVKPINPIIDYNTRFSGITKDQMDRTSTSILQVQANILHLCNSKTILIGHSLESDMKALKIIHSNIIDTAILFPHKFGLPHKRALKTLASEYLMKIIQNDVNGHDSAEDALTCMELIKFKLKDELKTRNIK